MRDPYIDPRYREWARASDLRPSTAARCPMVAAGRHHQYESTCVCQRYHLSVLDHVNVWLTGTREHILTAEPYYVSGPDMASFIRDMAELNLHVGISGRGRWHLSTIFVTVIPVGIYKRGWRRRQGAAVPVPSMPLPSAREHEARGNGV
jgi:hypothetical protein